MMNKPLNFQREVKENAEEYQTYLKELYHWEDEIKVKDENLKKSTSSCTQQSVSHLSKYQRIPTMYVLTLHRSTPFEAKTLVCQQMILLYHPQKQNGKLKILLTTKRNKRQLLKKIR